MADYDIAPGVAAALAAFEAPAKPGFGLFPAPAMYSAEFQDGTWGRGVLLPYGRIEVWPGARALQYAEVVFEGLKAYRVGQPWPNLFRPLDNARRLARSATRLTMTAVPEALFMQGVEAVTGACAELVPPVSGQALYLRPFLYGSESGLQLRNSASFRFMVLASPVEAYASGPIKVAIEREDVRAAPGGVGAAKAAANYAAAMRGSSTALARGCAIALWLDAHEHRYIQELSGMNLFAVIDGALHTPNLDDAILPGITRDSLLVLARHLGYTVIERPLLLEELLTGMVSTRCSELFACGTAAIVSPIGALVEADGREHRPAQVDAVAARLRSALLAIQERRAPDPFGWTADVARSPLAAPVRRAAAS